MTKSIANTKFKILTPNGFKNFEGVNILPSSFIFTIKLEDETEIKCTYRHKFVVEGQQISALELVPGVDFLAAKNGLKRVIDVIPSGEEKVYDIGSVEDGSIYYTNDVVSHNCKFLGSTALLVDGQYIEKIKVKNPTRTSFNDKFFIYQNPEPGAFYIIGVDSAEGTKLDSSIIQVLRVYSDKNIKQVAIYRSNEIEPNAFAAIVVEISRIYNEAYIMIENNAVGILVCNTIWNTLEYDKIVNTEKRGLGFKTTHKSKVAINMRLKRYLEHGWLTLCDKTTKHELSVFENAGENIWKASKGNHDDTVMALAIGLGFLETMYWDPSDIQNTQDRLEDSTTMPTINDTMNYEIAQTIKNSGWSEDEEKEIGDLFALFAEG